MFWQDKKVLVTGSEGLIGRPVVDKLTELGATVSKFDRLLGNDVTVLSDVYQQIDGIDICIHLAADSNVESSRDNPLNSWEVNIRGTWNVLEGAHELEVPATIIASSNHVYGQQDNYPVPESAQMNQMDTYSITKTCADYIGRAYAHNYDLPVSIIRNTNCFGPRDEHGNHIVPGTIQAILDGEVPVIRSSGRTKKGYLYVDDVVSAYLLIAEKLYDRQIDKGEVFNVGAPPTSSLDIVRRIQILMGDVRAPIVHGEPNDQADEDLDTTKIRNLGWRPEYSLEQGLIKTIEWFRKNRKPQKVTA